MTFTTTTHEIATIDTPNGKVFFEERIRKGKDYKLPTEYAVYGGGFNGTYTENKQTAIDRFAAILAWTLEN